jgi:hypothetical protein
VILASRCCSVRSVWGLCEILELYLGLWWSKVFRGKVSNIRMVGQRRARPLCVGVEFCDSDLEVLFGEVCLGFVQNIRALFRVVVE